MGLSSPPHPRPPPTPAPLNIPIEELTKAFANASLATLPDARLVLACPTGSSPDGSESVIIPLPRGIGGWDTVGVVQRTRDVDFVIDFPFWVRSRVEPFDLKCEQLKCRIYYNPASDDCLLVNEPWGHIYLTPLAPVGDDPLCLARFDHCVVLPGMWRISIFEGKEFRQHLLDFCLLRRQFVVDIAEAPAGAPSSTKRGASGDDEVTIKRQRLGEGDVSEILLAPTTACPQEAPGAIGTPNALTARIPGTLAATPSQQISRPGNTIALLHLLDGEVAIVRTATRPKNPDIDTPEAHGQTTARVSSPAIYERQRIGGVANTMSSSVFVGRHSEWRPSIDYGTAGVD